LKHIYSSYGKINIGLKVLGKRTDGFHNIETIFYPVSLHDVVKIEIYRSNNFKILIKTNKKYIPLGEKNTCFKIVNLFFQKLGLKTDDHIKIDILKNIPSGGGLGGGSSNAAVVLKHLIKYYNADMSIFKKEIREIAIETGSDVTFFLLQKPCYACGLGEKLKILNNFKIDFKILLVNPHMHISTKWAYDNLGMKEGEYKENVLNNIEEFSLNNPEIYINDFENIVFPKYPLLKNIKNDMLDKGAVFSSMTGSGATVYGFFKYEDKEALNSLYEYYKSKNYFTYIA